jgi:hypothetical protein
MISTETLFDVSRLNEVVNTFIDDSFVDNIQTRDLVRLGQSLQGMNAGRITFVTVPTTGLADEEGNEQPRTEDIQALFDAIIEDEPLPGENDNNETLSPLTVATMATQITTSPTTTTTSSSQTESGYPTSTTAPDSAADSAETTVTGEVTETTVTEEVKTVAAEPRDVTVQVGNATELYGLATATSGELDLYGFNVLAPDYSWDYGSVTETSVFYSLGNEQAAATVAATLPGARIERISDLGETVMVVLAPDFADLRYPQASGTPLTVSVTHAGSSAPTKLPSDLIVTNGADVTCE